MKKHICFVAIVFFLANLNIQAQEVQVHTFEDQEEIHDGHFSFELGALYGSIIIPEHDQHGEQIGYVFTPAVSLDYGIWYKQKFGFLFMNEIILNSYEIKTEQNEFITRESILVLSANVAYSPIKYWDVFVGYGYEFELGIGQNFGVYRVGSTYAIAIRKNWYSVLAINGDFRKQYASGSFEIGFAKHF